MARKVNVEKHINNQLVAATKRLVDDLRPLLAEQLRQEVDRILAEKNQAQLELFADTPAVDGVGYAFCDGGTLGPNATAKVLNDTIPPEATGVIEIDMSIPETEPPTDYAGLTGDGVTFSVAVGD
jgi:hypothetical protein